MISHEHPTAVGRNFRRSVRLNKAATSILGRVVRQRTLSLAVCFALLNLPYWWLQERQFLSRPTFNVELFLPLLLAARSVRTGSAVLAFLWALDWASSNSLTFYFSSPLDFVRSAAFLSFAHLWTLLPVERLWWLVPFAGFGTASLLLCRRNFDRRPPWRAALLLACAIVAVDVANGSSMLLNFPTRWIDWNPAGSPTITLLVKAYQQRGGSGLRQIPLEASTRKDIDVLSWARTHPGQSILFVIVESLGINQDEKLQRWLLDRLAPPELRMKYTVKESQVPFSGATTSAELREMCGLRGSYRYVTESMSLRCLPRQLTEMGWHTQGFHGFSGQMFSRDRWWREAGIAQSRFAADLLLPGQVACGAAFAGACDEGVIDEAGKAIHQQRTFAYVLTLNSHLPLREITIPTSLSAICKLRKSRREVCLLTATIGVALEAIARAVQSSSATKPLVVVVGDHAPPFSERETRGQYSQSLVPAYIIEPIATRQ